MKNITLKEVLISLLMLLIALIVYWAR